MITGECVSPRRPGANGHEHGDSAATESPRRPVAESPQRLEASPTDHEHICASPMRPAAESPHQLGADPGDHEQVCTSLSRPGADMGGHEHRE